MQLSNNRIDTKPADQNPITRVETKGATSASIDSYELESKGV